MPMTLLEQMKSSVTPQFVGYAAKLLGETPANIEKAVGLALPAILSSTASASHVASGQTGQSVVSRLVADPVNDGTLLHRLPALYQGTMTAAPIYRLGAQLLQAIFGSKLGKVTQTIAALSGIKPASSALLINTLAPHVLSILGKRHRMSGEATATGLAHLFDAEHASLAAAVPAALSQLIGTPVAAHATAGSAAIKTAAAAKPAAVAKVVSPVAASPVVASMTTPVDPRPTVTKQSYRWSSWLPVLAMYGLGAGGLALLLTSQPEAPSPNPVTGGKSAQISPAPSVPAKTVPAKTVEAAKPSLPAPAPVASPPAKTVEAAKPAAPAKPAPAAKPAATAPAATAPVKTAEAAKPAVATPAAPASNPPKGMTSYFGTTPPVAETAAKMNPDYKPATAAVAETASTQIAATAPAPDAPAAPAPAAPMTAPAPVSPKGVTSFFGVTPPVAEAAAKMNPDYMPAVTATAAVATEPTPESPAASPAPAPETAAIPAEIRPASPAPSAVAEPAPANSAEPAPAKNGDAARAKNGDAAPAKSATATPSKPASQPGVTSYFGTSPEPAEQAAIANPDYRPAPPPVKEPSLAQAAIAAVTSLITPTPPRPSGVTSYYGSTPANQEAAARPNPDYKPSSSTPPAAAPATLAATAAPAAPAADVAACRTSVANAVKKGRIVFQSARADLKSTSIATLDRLATAFKACPNARLKVEGHTDSTGLPETNQKLSQARAQTVADYLAKKGIESTRVTPVGMGSARPVAPNTTALNKARNRRIEFAVENL